MQGWRRLNQRFDCLMDSQVNLSPQKWSLPVILHIIRKGTAQRPTAKGLRIVHENQLYMEVSATIFIRIVHENQLYVEVSATIFITKHSRDTDKQFILSCWLRVLHVCWCPIRHNVTDEISMMWLYSIISGSFHEALSHSLVYYVTFLPFMEILCNELINAFCNQYWFGVKQYCFFFVFSLPTHWK